MITIIVNATSANDFIGRYLLISTRKMVAVVHHQFQPYSINALNSFDGLALQLMIMVAVLPVVEYFDRFNLNLVTAIIVLC